MTLKTVAWIAANGAQSQLEATVHGFTVAFAWASVFMLAAAIVSFTFIRATNQDLPVSEAAMAG